MGDMASPAAALPPRGAPISLQHRAEVVSENRSDIVVCTYNILANEHIDPNPGIYPHCPKHFLKRPYRHAKLMEEVPHLNADVFCMQEVEASYYHATLQPAMAALGYQGTFLKKSAHRRKDGQATFWRAATCRLLTVTDMHLNNLAHALCAPRGLDAAQCRLLHNTVALLVHLEVMTARGPREVYVTNCHQNWNWQMPDMQCLQNATLLSGIHKMTRGDGVPHLIVGDFNAKPDSPAFAVIAEGAPDLRRDMQRLLDSSPGPDVPWESLIKKLPITDFMQPMRLTSAYRAVLGREAPYSTLTNDFEGTIDHLFSSQGIRPTKALAPPPRADLLAYGGAPNQDFPSDHLPFRAAFVFE